MNKNYDNILDFVSLKVICRKPDVLKLVRCVCEWFFALHSLIVLRKINVVCCRLNRWSSAEILNLISGHVIDYLTYLMTLFFIAFQFLETTYYSRRRNYRKKKWQIGRESYNYFFGHISNQEL